ncbi:hypothetical protein Esti_002675 [Eimeria stiedai]
MAKKEDEDVSSEEEESSDGSGSDESVSEDSEEEGEERQKEKKKSGRKKQKETEGSKKRKTTSREKGTKRRRGVSAFLDVEAQVGDEEDEEEGDEFIDPEEAREASRLAAKAAEARRAAAQRQQQQEWGRRGGAAHLVSAIDSLTRRYQDQSFEEGEEDEDDFDDAEALDCTNTPWQTVQNQGVSTLFWLKPSPLLILIRLLWSFSDGVTSMLSAYLRADDESAEANILPDMRDPKLWMVRLNKSGTEREEVIAILNKCFVHSKLGTDLQIYSVFASDDLKGYVYVEAESQFAVKEALQGFRNLRVSGDIRMVPLKEMPGVFSQLKAQKQPLPQRGDFVRVRRGVYANDLAQIVSADEQGIYVTARLIPRIDLAAMLDRESGASKDAGSRLASAKRSGRPEKRFFDRERVDASGGQVEQGLSPGTVRFGGCTFEEAGYIVKRIPVRHLLLGALAAPSLAELREFSQPMSDADKEEWINGRRPLTQLLKQQRSAYRLGDRVLVIQGELLGMRGKVSEQPQTLQEGGDGQLLVLLDDPKFGAVRLKASEVRKDFREGECVRALQGVNAGHSGLITHIDTNTFVATVFSPSSCIEFKCALESLTHAPQSGAGEDGLLAIRGFSLLDFVEITSGEKGVLVFIDRNGSSVRLLLPNNTIIHATAAQLNTKIQTELQTTTDVNKNIIERHSLVRLACRGCNNPLCSCPGGSAGASSLGGSLGGPTGGVPQVEGMREGGQVMHVWKDILFVRVKGKTDNAGMIAIEASAVSAVGGDGVFKAPRPLGGGGRQPFRGVGPRGGGGGRGSLRFGRRVDSLVGKQVKVQKGRHKGVIANVRAVDRDELTVLLQTKSEVVKIAKTDVQVLESGRDYARAVGALNDSSASRMSISFGRGDSSLASSVYGDREGDLPSGCLTPVSRAADLLPSAISHRNSVPPSPASGLDALIDEDAVSLSDLSLSLGSGSSMSVSNAAFVSTVARNLRQGVGASFAARSAMSVVSEMDTHSISSNMRFSAAASTAGDGGRQELPSWCLKGGVLVSVDAERRRAVVSSGGGFCAVSDSDIEPLSVTSQGQQAMVVDGFHSLYANSGTIKQLSGAEAVLEIHGREETMSVASLAQAQRV